MSKIIKLVPCLNSGLPHGEDVSSRDDIFERNQLEPKDKLFVVSYLLTGSAEQAGKFAKLEVGGGRTLKAVCEKKMKEGKIRDSINEIMSEIVEKVVLSKERIMEEVAKVAFSDPVKMLKIDKEGNTSFDADKMLKGGGKAIKGIKQRVVTTINEETGGETKVVELQVEFLNKLQALGMLSKQLDEVEKVKTISGKSDEMHLERLTDPEREAFGTLVKKMTEK